MLQLLKVEWLKLKNYRTFWVLSILYAISNYGVAFIAYKIYLDITEDFTTRGVGRAILGDPPFDFPAIWLTVAWWCGFLLFIPGLLVIISVTNEFSYKTHRQNIVDGWSRMQFISVKLGLVFLVSLIATLIVGITTVIMGLQGGSSFSLNQIEYLLYFFLQALAYCSVALLLSLLIKRSGLTIGVYFLYVFLLENAFGAWLSYKFNDLGKYLPLNSTDSLIPFPFVRNLTEAALRAPVYSILLPLSVGYLLLYTFFSIRKFRRDDL
jgi:ABC-2 type transport system permease protein